jgi:hypothetical protein
MLLATWAVRSASASRPPPERTDRERNQPEHDIQPRARATPEFVVETRGCGQLERREGEIGGERDPHAPEVVFDHGARGNGGEPEQP